MWIFLEDKLIVTKELNGQLLGLEDLDPVHQWFEHLLIAKIEKLKKDSNGTWMFESISSNVFNNQPGLVFSPIFCLFFLWKRMNWVLLEQILTLCSLDTSINYFFFIREQFLKTRETTTWEVLNTAVTRKVLNPISACHPDWNNALPILSSKELSNPWSSSFYQFHLFPCCQSSNFSKCALWSYFLKSNAQNALETFYQRAKW